MASANTNRGWLWYFLVLAFLTAVATATLAIYNQRQQLKPDVLQAAVDRWKQFGPKDYKLTYTIKRDDNKDSDHYLVLVEGGVTRDVRLNGQPLGEDRLPYFGMSRLLQDISRFMEIDQEKGRPKTYTRGIFNPTTGAVIWYVRRVMGTTQRVEIAVELLTVP